MSKPHPKSPTWCRPALVRAVVAVLLSVVACGCERSTVESRPCTLADGTYPTSFDSVNIDDSHIVGAIKTLSDFARQQSGGGVHEALSPTPHQACREAWSTPPSGPSMARSFELTALHTTHLGPAIHTVIYEARATKGTWRATLNIRFAGDSAEHNYFELTFDGPGAAKLQLGSHYVRYLEMTRVETHAPGLDAGSARARMKRNHEELLRLRKSPQSFAETASQRIEALAAAARRRLGEGADRCEPDMALYEGGGIPPPCKAVPLTASETTAQQKKVDAELAAQKAVIIADSEQLHALLSAMLPADIW